MNGPRSTLTTVLPRFSKSARASLSGVDDFVGGAAWRLPRARPRRSSCRRRESLPQALPDDDRHQRLGDVAGEDDVLLHLVELLRVDGGQRILLRIDGAVLQREVHLGERDRRGIGADGAREHHEERRIGHAQLHALHVLGLGHQLVGGEVALRRSRCSPRCGCRRSCPRSPWRAP